MGRPKVGLYVIVRDAADTIGTLLESVRTTFDEYVFVDTGSGDGTQQKILDFMGSPPGLRWPDEGTHSTPQPGTHTIPRIVLASFRWIDDFAAARNYAFSLGTAKWRMYLDADDVWPKASLRGEIELTEKEHPEVNCIAMPYRYDEQSVQDKHRVFRWDDGWTWKDPIHEHCDRIGGPRMIHSARGYVIEHRRRPGDELKSFHRNARIIRAALERATAAGDLEQQACMTYYMATTEIALGLDPRVGAKDPKEAQVHVQSALELLHRTTELAPFSNYGHLACVHAGLLALEDGQPERAALAAGQAIAHATELPEGWLLMGCAHEARGDHHRAELAFDVAFGKPSSHPFRTIEDQRFTEGQARLYAARTYLAVGRIDDAEKCLIVVSGSPAVRDFQTELSEVHAELMQARGLEVLKAYTDFLCWDTQPLEALRILSHYVPATLAGHPSVAAMSRTIKARLPQIYGEGRNAFERYKRVYDAIPDATGKVQGCEAEHLLPLGRAQAAVAWVREHAQPIMGGIPDETAIRVLSIGSLNGIIERKQLEASDRIHMTLVDVSEVGSGALAALERDFPGRVKRHVMEGLTDWIPRKEERSFDLVTCFEVIEHLEDPQGALDVIADALHEGGELLLSTPMPERWVEPYLTQRAPAVYWHVAAFPPAELEDMLQGAGLVGRLEATDGGQVYLARRRKQIDARCEPACTKHSHVPQDVAIHVPSTPLPFDPDTLKHGHLGGSEEAVVHLAAAMAARGARVTVYAPRPKRSDGVVVHAHEGVLWRTPDRFDPEGTEHDAVLFWREPTALLDERVKRARYVKLLWLHDAQYGAPKAAYESADAVIALSAFHRTVLVERDELGGASIPWRFATNGIDRAAFESAWSEERDPRKVIYSSSPDRGLEHLLDLWPKVREEVPDATLDVYYSWALLESQRPDLAARLRAKAEALAAQGVTVRGGVSHDELHAAMRRAGVWAYPTDFEEISCITAMKALASGCTPVTSRFGALDETLGPWGKIGNRPDGSFAGWNFPPSSYPGWLEKVYLPALVGALLLPDASHVRLDRAAWALNTYGWDRVAGRFLEIVEEAVRAIPRRSLVVGKPRVETLVDAKGEF